MPHCDIIIPVWNQPEATERCIDSVVKNTGYPYRLVIIDNASDHKTAAYLVGLQERFKKEVILLRNTRNEGFIKAVNKGMAHSKGEFICILNNDTIVTEGWLGEMVKLLTENAEIGIVNPSSNSLGQSIPKGKSVNEFAGEGKNASGRFVELESAFGFCMLMRRCLLGKVGYFDETYGTGNFDDTDFSLRVKREGHKVVRAFASYVYHKGQRSFRGVKSFRSDFKKNKEIFESRWGKTKRVVVVLKDTDRLDSLRNILKKHAGERSWAHIISPGFRTEELFEKYSNLSVSVFRRFFYLQAFFKVAFKKKKPDIVYCGNRLFLGALKILSGMKVSLISGALK